MSMTNVGEKLRDLREILGYKQSVVAEALGLNNAALSYMESGKRMPSAEELGKLARFFRVPVGEFYRQPRPLQPVDRQAMYVFEYELDEEERKHVAETIFSTQKMNRRRKLPFSESPFLRADSDGQDKPRRMRPLRKTTDT